MEKQNKMIEDFGEKIGGAKKDLYYLNGLFDMSAIKDWTKIERENLLIKKTVFPKPDYQKMKDDGMAAEAVYFIKKMYDSLPVRPTYPTEEYQKGYIAFMNYFQQALSEVKTIEDACNFFKDKVLNSPFIERNEYGLAIATEQAYGCMTNKPFKAAQANIMRLQREVKEKQFLYTQDEKYLAKYLFFRYDGNNAQMEKQYNGKETLVAKIGGSKYYFYNVAPNAELSNWKPDTYVALPLNDRFNPIEKINFPTIEDAKNAVIEAERAKDAEAPQKSSNKGRKQNLVPPQLSHIIRKGEDYRDGKNISGQDMLDIFGFRGGEFGNWENQNDRQANLNMSYDAFKDLAVALGVQDGDISLKNLAIAYGARGSGSAVAHYEPDRNVINLTKMSGAGSLAHEFGHALDSYIREIELIENEKSVGGAFASEGWVYTRNAVSMAKPEYPIAKTIYNLMKAMIYTDDSRTSYSNFFKNAKSLDKHYSRRGHQGKAYWSSDCELFARAFSVYVLDSLKEKGIDSPYLTGHAEISGMTLDGTPIPTFPTGVERQKINEAFDKVIEALKDFGYLHQKDNDLIQRAHSKKQESIERD